MKRYENEGQVQAWLKGANFYTVHNDQEARALARHDQTAIMLVDKVQPIPHGNGYMLKAEPQIFGSENALIRAMTGEHQVQRYIVRERTGRIAGPYEGAKRIIFMSETQGCAMTPEPVEGQDAVNSYRTFLEVVSRMYLRICDMMAQGIAFTNFGISDDILEQMNQRAMLIGQCPNPWVTMAIVQPVYLDFRGITMSDAL